MRAAFDIGTGGAITAVVARVDAAQQQIRETLYFTQLPLSLGFIAGTNTLTPDSAADVNAKLHMLMGTLSTFKAVSEFAGILSGTLRSADNAPLLAKRWTREHKVALSVAADDAERLEFDGYVAATHALHKDNVLVIIENELTYMIELVGLMSDADSGSSPALLKCAIPLTALNAHRLLITEVQRRNAEHYHVAQSPNPVQRGEYISLRSLLEKAISPMLPTWVHDKSRRECVIAGTSHNGGMLNIAARASRQSMISLEHLQMAAEHQHCGLTDVLLGENYPNPYHVLPQIALCEALMRAMKTVRIQYLPEVSTAHGILLSPQYWAQGKEGDLMAAAHSKSNQEMLRQRAFDMPHQARHRSNPNAPPNSGTKYLRMPKRARDHL